MIIPVRCFSCGAVIAHSGKSSMKSSLRNRSFSALDPLDSRDIAVAECILGTWLIQKFAPFSAKRVINLRAVD